MTFRQILEESDEVPIDGNGANIFIYAYGTPNNSFGQHSFNDRGAARLTLSSCVPGQPPMVALVATSTTRYWLSMVPFIALCGEFLHHWQLPCRCCVAFFVQKVVSSLFTFSRTSLPPSIRLLPLP